MTGSTCVKFRSSSHATDTFPTYIAEKSGIFPSLKYKHRTGVNMKQLQILPCQEQVSDSSLEISEHSAGFGLYSLTEIIKYNIYFHFPT